jgi:hypothetical protein
VIVTTTFKLGAVTQPLNIAGSGGYIFRLVPGIRELTTNKILGTLNYPINGSGERNEDNYTFGLLSTDVPGSRGDSPTFGGYETAFPWRFGSFPILVRAVGFNSRIHTFYVTSSEPVIVEEGFTMLTVEPLVPENIGYWTITTGSSKYDRLGSSVEQYRLTQMFVNTTPTYNAATGVDNAPSNTSPSPTGTVGIPLKNAVGWRVGVQASGADGTRTILTGTIRMWYRGLTSAGANYTNIWGLTDFLFTPIPGAAVWYSPDVEVAVPNGYIWPELISLTASAGVDPLIFLEVTYASR